MTYYFIPTRVATVNKMNNDKYWQGCKEIGALIHCWWNVKWSSHLGRQFAIPPNVKHGVTIWP